MSYQVVPGTNIILVEPDGTVKIGDSAGVTHLTVGRNGIVTVNSPTTGGHGIQMIQTGSSGSFGSSQLILIPDTEDTDYPGFYLVLRNPGTSESDRIVGLILQDGDGSDLAVIFQNQSLGNLGIRNTGTGSILFQDASANNIVSIDNAGNVTIGHGAAGVNYALTFDGNNNDGTITFYENLGYFDFSRHIVIDSNPLLSSLRSGALEFYNDRMYFTDAGVRRVLDRSSDVITSSTTVSNTTTETTIYTGDMPSDSFKVGNVFQVRTNGIISNATSNDEITMRVYIGSTMVSSFKPPIGNITDEEWHSDFEITVRSVGGSGSLAFHGFVQIAARSQRDVSIETIDTTAQEDVTVTVQWDNARAGNEITIYQGYMSLKG